MPRFLHVLLLACLLLPLGPLPAQAATISHDHLDIRARDPFTLATFNVLGHSHTAPGGKKASYAGSATRMRYTVRALNYQGIEVVGFQEFEDEQKRSFDNIAGSRWGIWAGSERGRNPIAWRKASFEFVRGDTILIPYFYGDLLPMPVVLLRSKVTGQRMYFANFHLPANSSRVGNEERWRDEGTVKHIRLAHRLRTDNKAVFVIGDMNEREEYFCKLTRNGEMHAANGGSNSDRCLPPQPPDRARIDWIFGSKGIRFSDYRAVESRRIQRASDHALIVSRVG